MTRDQGENRDVRVIYSERVTEAIKMGELPQNKYVKREQDQQLHLGEHLLLRIARGTNKNTQKIWSEKQKENHDIASRTLGKRKT